MPIILQEGYDRNINSVSKRLNPSSNAIKNLQKKYLNYQNKNCMFTEVGIETISRCNGRCSFCPVSVQNEKRPLSIMTDDTWNKIINQLADINFSGSLFPYINNEFLLDKKIFERLEYARKKLGDDVKISVETNGRLLVEKGNRGIELIQRLSNIVDQIVINDYANTEENYKNFNPRIRYLRDNIDKIKTTRKVRLVLQHRWEIQLLNNRSGMVEGFEKQEVPDEAFCDLPFFQFNINPDGDSFICCRDSYFQEIVGNIHKNSIMEIWRGERYDKIRRAFINNERICDVCKKCTSSGTLTI